MKLQEIFNQLTSGEFNQMSVGGQKAGTINEGNYKMLVDHINLGLTTLYRRFKLKEGALTVALQSGMYTYPLVSTYAVNNRRSREAVRFILDEPAAQFADDIHKIERVFTDLQVELPLNERAARYTCLTPTMTTLVVAKEIVDPTTHTPHWMLTKQLTVVYRANHPLLSVGTGFFDPAREIVELPYSHLEALIYFVASRVNQPETQGDLPVTNNYYAKYEAACKELEAQDMQIDSLTQEHRAWRNNWA